MEVCLVGCVVVGSWVQALGGISYCWNSLGDLEANACECLGPDLGGIAFTWTNRISVSFEWTVSSICGFADARALLRNLLAAGVGVCVHGHTHMRVCLTCCQDLWDR